MSIVQLMFGDSWMYNNCSELWFMNGEINITWTAFSTIGSWNLNARLVQILKLTILREIIIHQPTLTLLIPNMNKQKLLRYEQTEISTKVFAWNICQIYTVQLVFLWSNCTKKSNKFKILHASPKNIVSHQKSVSAAYHNG